MTELYSDRIQKTASGAKPRQLVILLHGLGSDANDLISLAPYFAERMPEAEFISPNAPFPCDMAPFGYQWFSVQDRSLENSLEGIKIAAPILNDFIDKELRKRSMTDKDLILIGFSQGAMMALYTALRRTDPCAAVLAYSGMLFGHEDLNKPNITKPPIFLAHGDSDDVVDVSNTESAYEHLKNADFKDIKKIICPRVGHSIDEASLTGGIKFILERTDK